jgi:hypothetical protein
MASRALNRSTTSNHKSFGKRMSGHIAYALVAYTLMLIFVVAPAMETGGTAIWPYLLLVALVGLAILPCRNLERRWLSVVGDAGEGRFWREAIILWASAIGLPVLLMLAIRAIS